MVEDTDYYKYYNANPSNHDTYDCVIRSLAVVLQKSWDDVFDDLVHIAHELKYDIADPHVYGRYLEINGYKKFNQLTYSDNTRYSAKDFCTYLDNAYGLNVPVFARVGSWHVTSFVNGDNTHHKIWDTWNCGESKVGPYWVKLDF